MTILNNKYLKTFSAALIVGATTITQPTVKAEEPFISINTGTETDYNFVVKNLNETNYYKITIKPNKIGTTDEIIWSTDSKNATGSVDVLLPNNEIITLYYTHTSNSNVTQGRAYNTEYNNSDFTRDFINLSETTSSSSNSSRGGALYNSGKINDIKGNFLENYVTAVGGALGGGIYNKGEINSISGDFVRNYTLGSGSSKVVGGAIHNENIIRNINGDFIGNHSSSSSSYTVSGGAIYNENIINSINGNFIGNTTNSSYSMMNSSLGGAIANNYNYTNTGNIINSINGIFVGNSAIAGSTRGSASGGAIYNDSTIGKICADFIGNYVDKTTTYINSENPYYSRGGAIYNLGKLEVTNSKFLSNYANIRTGEQHAQGGAIYTRNDLTISANNGISEFSGNYISTDNALTKDYQAIFVDSSSNTLNLQTKNNGTIIFNDKISGLNGYKINIDGDTTSRVELNNVIENAQVQLNNTNLYLADKTLSDTNTSTAVNSGTINLANGKSENYEINKLTSSNNANYTIDVDNSVKLAPVPDRIITGTGSSGTITISEINMQNNANDFNTQVLVAQDDNIQLDLSDNVKEKFNTTSEEILYTSDKMKADVNWQDKFHSYQQTKTTSSQINLGTTNTTNDSIIYKQDIDLGEVVEVGYSDNTLALLNQYDTNEKRNFNFDTAKDTYIVHEDLGTTAAGVLNINGIAKENERSTINGNNHSLFVLNNETELNLNNIKITGAKSVVTGSSKDAIVTLNNSEISNNTSGIKTAGSVNIKGNGIISNNGNGIEVTSQDSIITLDATNSEIILNDRLSGVRGSRLNIKGGTVNFAKKVSVLDTSLFGTNINLKNDNVFNSLNMTVEKQSTINMTNNAVNTMGLHLLNLKDNLNLSVDVDLANKSMDRIQASNYELGKYFVNITRMNLLSDAKNPITRIFFADNSLKNNVKTPVSEVAYSPIWKYGVSYDKDTGNFIFTRGNGNLSGSIDNLNPAVLASPVAAQVGGYMNMLDTYQNAFTHMDMNMLKPLARRTAEINANRYAISDNMPVAYNSNEMNSSGMWFKPYASYDSVRFKNGPKVNNMSYGSFIGGDTSIHQFKNGFSGTFSPYIAYQGSHQSYSGNSIYQNGGTLGFTGTLYKGNFFTGLTAAIGANVAEANTMYGHDDFGMLMTGVATKTGYNFEFNDGRFILQPSLMLSYTMVDSFNYTNTAGVSIHSDPLHALQIAPQVRFIMNTKSGWQPYLTASMNWNLLDETNVTANITSLPDMSVKPYFQYGVGIQRTMKDRLTGFLQIVLRNGGRNGIAATGGLRYIIGREKKKSKQRV